MQLVILFLLPSLTQSSRFTSAQNVGKTLRSKPSIGIRGADNRKLNGETLNSLLIRINQDASPSFSEYAGSNSLDGFTNTAPQENLESWIVSLDGFDVGAVAPNNGLFISLDENLSFRLEGGTQVCIRPQYDIDAQTQFQSIFGANAFDNGFTKSIKNYCYALREEDFLNRNSGTNEASVTFTLSPGGEVAVITSSAPLSPVASPSPPTGSPGVSTPSPTSGDTPIGTVDISESPGNSEAEPDSPSVAPSTHPSYVPSDSPSAVPSRLPSDTPSTSPSDSPSYVPSDSPSAVPSRLPSDTPSTSPSDSPSSVPSDSPLAVPSVVPTTVDRFREAANSSTSSNPTERPSGEPSGRPSSIPTVVPSFLPSLSLSPTGFPRNIPTISPGPTFSPSPIPRFAVVRVVPDISSSLTQADLAAIAIASAMAKQQWLVTVDGVDAPGGMLTELITDSVTAAVSSDSQVCIRTIDTGVLSRIQDNPGEVAPALYSMDPFAIVYTKDLCYTLRDANFRSFGGEMIAEISFTL